MPSLSKTMPRPGIVAATTQPAPEQAHSASCDLAVIEMFGMPGVGKTTLVTAVIREECHVARRKLTAAWNRLPLRKRGAFLMRAFTDARCLGAAARFALRTRLTSRDSLVRLVRLVAKTEWMRSQRGDLLLDESFLQEIWSICISAGRSDVDRLALTPFIRCLYAGLPTQVVFVEAEAAVASERINGRTHGRSRLDGLAAAEVAAQLRRTARLPHSIIAAATAAGLPIERLDAADPVEANADRVRKMLVRPPKGQDGD